MKAGVVLVTGGRLKMFIMDVEPGGNRPLGTPLAPLFRFLVSGLFQTPTTTFSLGGDGFRNSA